jgi:hypothetical protein
MPEKSGIDAAPRLRSCVNAGEENSAAAETVMMINARVTEFSPFKWATPPRPTVAASSALAENSANLLESNADMRPGPGRPHFGEAMITRSFGSTGLMVSALGLGCNNFGRRLDLGKTRTVDDLAIEAGINFFDTADVYGDRGGSETLLGATLGNAART